MSGWETRGQTRRGPAQMLIGKADQSRMKNHRNEPLPESLKGGWATCTTREEFTAWLKKREAYSWGPYGAVAVASLTLGNFEDVGRRWAKKAEPVPPPPTMSRLP